MVIQLGPNDDSDNDQLDLTFGGTATGVTNPFDAASATALNVEVGAGADINLLGSGTATDRRNAITAIDTAITTINARRGLFGALANRLEGAANNLMTAIENLSASESRIRNVDVASESANMVRNQILQQSAATVLAQANQAPSLALSLLQG